MINTRDLRIGNYVNFISDNIPIIEQVEIITSDTINNKDISSWDSDYFHPIDLTEEWLLKLEFVKLKFNQFEFRNKFAKKRESSVFKKNDIRVNIHKLTNTISVSNYNGNLCHYDIKFVNQLQNIYFITTGTELKLKI